MPLDDQVVVFGDRYGTNGYPGTQATRSPMGPTSGTFSIGAGWEATAGMGGSLAGGGVMGFDSQGNFNVGVFGSAQVTSGVNGGGAAIVGVGPNSTLNSGITRNPVASLNIAAPTVGVTGAVNLADPASITLSGFTVGFKPGVSFGVGAEITAAATAISGNTIDSVTDSTRSIFGLNNLSDSAHDYRGPDTSRVSPTYGGTYGGPNQAGSYSDNGSNYGGIDGNTAPNGSAINGLD